MEKINVRAHGETIAAALNELIDTVNKLAGEVASLKKKVSTRREARDAQDDKVAE